jgi:Ca2+-binding RTX toxin-like protein
VGLTGDFGYPMAVQLGQGGGELGGGSVNQDVVDEYGYARTAYFNRIAGFGDEPYVLWNLGGSKEHGAATYVSHVVDGKWEIAGGNVGDGIGGTSLRSIGGRLYAAWLGDPGSPDLHVSRLSDDGTSWVATPSLDGMAADQAATLSSLDGVPYVAWVKTDGTTRQLVVERLDGAPEPIAGDDGEGSGPGTDPEMNATPIYPPDPPDDPPGSPGKGTCSTTMPGTAGPDRLSAGLRSARIRGFAGADRELGSDASDCLFGNAGSDVLRGRGGEDSLYGGLGSDQLFGGGDEDKLTGGPGADRLSGGMGWDTFRGGPGADTILAADGRGEQVWCGPGDDTARLDRFDHPHGCEHVRVARKRWRRRSRPTAPSTFIAGATTASGSGVARRNTSRYSSISGAKASGLGCLPPASRTRPSTERNQSSVRPAGLVSQRTRASAAAAFHIWCLVPRGMSIVSPACSLRSGPPSSRAVSSPASTSKCSSCAGCRCGGGGLPLGPYSASTSSTPGSERTTVTVSWGVSL